MQAPAVVIPILQVVPYGLTTPVSTSRGAIDSIVGESLQC